MTAPSPQTYAAEAAAAWQAYLDSGGVQTANLITSTGSNITGVSGVSSTLYNSGYSVTMTGAKLAETVFVGGYGGPIMNGGTGANDFTFLSVSDSPGAGLQTSISQFDPNKDVIDLSYINSNPNNIAGASSNFTFIGTSSFTAAGDQVRYQYNAATNRTLVEANLAGDDNPNAPDFEISLVGQVNLTAANFALTSSQSSAALAAAAALVSTRNTSVAGAVENLYSNVRGQSYTSFQEIHSTGGYDAAMFDNADGSGTIDVYNPYLTVSAGSSGWSITDGAGTFAITPHTTETVNESFGDDNYQLSKGFGNFTVSNFRASGTTPDKLHLATSMFNYLNGSMSQAADLAAVISHATFSGGNATISDSYGDSLTLVGVTKAMLTADSKHIAFA